MEENGADEASAWPSARKGGGTTPAPSHPPTTAPDEEGITEVDCLRQKGREKRARSKQRMYSPIEGRMQTQHRRPLPSYPTTQRNGRTERVVGWKVL